MPAARWATLRGRFPLPRLFFPPIADRLRVFSIARLLSLPLSSASARAHAPLEAASPRKDVSTLLERPFSPVSRSPAFPGCSLWPPTLAAHRLSGPFDEPPPSRPPKRAPRARASTHARTHAQPTSRRRVLFWSACTLPFPYFSLPPPSPTAPRHPHVSSPSPTALLCLHASSSLPDRSPPPARLRLPSSLPPSLLFSLFPAPHRRRSCALSRNGNLLLFRTHGPFSLQARLRMHRPPPLCLSPPPE